MSLSASAAYTIGTAARLTGVPAWKLRAWEAAGLMCPDRSRSGYRIYHPVDLDEIVRVRDAVDRVGMLGAHALASTVPNGDGASRRTDPSRPSRALIGALDMTLDVRGARWAGLLWREEAGQPVLLASAGSRAETSVVLSPTDDRAWTRILMDGELGDAPPDLGEMSGSELTVLPLHMGPQRGVLLTHRATRPSSDQVDLLLASMLTASLQTEAAEAAADDRARHERAARQLEEVVATHATLEPLLRAAVAVFVELTGCDSAEVALADRTGRRLLVPVTRGVSPRFVAGCAHFRSDEGLAGRAFQTRRPVTTRDLRNDPRVTRQAVREEGLRSYLSLPLVHRGRSIGVLQLGSRTDAIDDDDGHIMSLTGRLATAIDVLELARELEDERRKRAVAVRAWAARLSTQQSASRDGEAHETVAAGDALEHIARSTAEAADPTMALELDTSGWRGSVSHTAAVEVATVVRAIVETAGLDDATRVELRLVRDKQLTVVGRHRRPDPSLKPAPLALGPPWSVSQQLAPEHVVNVATYRNTSEDADESLTPRETEILQLFGESHSTREVAALLGVSTKTICNRLTLMYVKLGVAGRTQAVTEAIRRGLVHVG